MSDVVQKEMQRPAQGKSAAPAVVTRNRSPSPFDWLRQEVDHLFDDFGLRQRRLFDWPAIEVVRLPSVDLDDRGKEFRLTAELPGFEAKEVNVEFEDGALRIIAVHEESREEKSERMLLSERRRGRIERLVALPQAIDAGSAKAKLKDGVLSVTLPKRESPKSSGQKIPVTG